MTSLINSSARIFLVAGLIAVLVQSAFAHTYLSSVYLNNEALADGDCVRPHPSTAFDSPIALVSDADMTCGWLPQSASPANRKCPIAAGSTIGIQWHHQTTDATDDIIDPSHLGPIIVYLAKSDTGAGNVWFKIYEDGYTASDGKWAVDRLLANAGRVDVPLPSDIAPGNYLLRGELIALHGAYALNGVQPYVGCVELTISGSGTANPSGVAFPGYYTNTDPGMLFNLYQAYTSYPIPGPARYVSGSTPSSSGSSTVAPTKAPTSAPTTAPTSRPSTAPTSVPTVPASAPTYAPIPTYTPTTAPTSAPTSPSNANILVELNGGSSAWWLGVIVSGGGETTVKVELMDSGAVSSWTALVVMPYAYVYDMSIQLTLPISIRLTSSTGKQVTLPNVFTSMTVSLINTGKTYASSTTTPTVAPTTKPTTAPTTKPTTAPTATPTAFPTVAPTTKPTTTPTAKPTTAPTATPTATPTTKPTTAPTPSPSGSTKVTVYPSASNWWFALTVSGNSAAVTKVELKDAGSVSAWTTMTYNPWGYSYATQGTPLVTPLTVRVTSASGQSVTATISAITPNAVITASGQL